MEEEYLENIKEKESLVPVYGDKREILYYTQSPIKKPSKYIEVKNTSLLNDMTSNSIDEDFNKNKKLIDANSFPGRVFLGSDNNYYMSILLGKKYVWEFVRRG